MVVNRSSSGGVVTVVTTARWARSGRCCGGSGSRALRSAGETAHETAGAASSGVSCGRHNDDSCEDD